MKTFKVTLERRVVERVEIEVRAVSRLLAEDKAIEKAESDSDTKWEFCVADEDSSPWVAECEEIK